MFIVLGLYSRIWYLFLHQSAPPVGSPCNPTNREVAQLSNDAMDATWLFPMGSNQKQRCCSEFTKWHDIYTPEECADEWRQSNADFKLLCHEWIHHVRHHVHDGHCIGEFATVIWRLDSFTVSFRDDVGGKFGLRELASVNRWTSQWAWPNYKNILPAWFEKFWCMC